MKIDRSQFPPLGAESFEYEYFPFRIPDPCMRQELIARSHEPRARKVNAEYEEAKALGALNVAALQQILVAESPCDTGSPRKP